MPFRQLLRMICLPVILLFSLIVTAQNRVITGRVTSASGAALPGVSVTIKNQSLGTTTGDDGQFSLTVPANVNTLVISSVGFASQEVDIAGQTTLNITLQSAAGTLNEVVVVGYGTQRRKDLTGSITTVSSDDFQKGVIPTPEQLIVGKVAGVQITSNSGAPGAGSTIRIRGGSSVNASNDPLIVIDGVPISTWGISGAANPLSLINPNDIESFNVLKDASATAIYGSRASNGVIIITTKKGRRGAPVINFSTQFSAARKTNEVEVLNADQFRELINAKGDAKDIGLLGNANTNWQDEIFQTAYAQDNNLSVSGALNNIPYRVSAGFLNQNGILKGGNLKRSSLALNLSPRFFDEHLRVDINLRGALSKNKFANEGAIGAAVSFDPTQNVYADGKRFGGYFEWLDPRQNLVSLGTRNPVALLELREDKSTVKRSLGNIQFDYKFHFLPDLRANVNLGYDVSKGEGNVFIPDSAASNYQQGGLRNHYEQKNSNKLLETYLNYAKDIAGINSRIDVLAGYSYQDFITTNYAFASLNAKGDTLGKPLFPFNEPQYTLISFYGRLNYSYKSRYLLTASLRQDGSSRFSKDNRWGLFPALALAWNVAEEPFLKGSETVSGLKFRLGYGVTGQQEGIGLYDYISYYGLSNNEARYQLGDTYYNMYRPSGYYPGRTWEQTATYNAGLDFGFFNNRINANVDVYLKKTTDLLNEVVQPAGTNFSNTIVANVGSMENRGIEFNINAQPIRNEKATLDLNFNVTYNKNEITNLTITDDPNYPGNRYGGIAGGTGGSVLINTVGFPRGSFYVFQQVYNTDGTPIEGLFMDRNEDGIINEKDLYQYKNADPKVFMGFSSNATFGKWDAAFTMRANIGNYVYNNVYSNLGRYSVVSSLDDFLNNVSVNYLDTRFEGGYVNQVTSDYYLQNASFLRMDNLNVGYNFGKVFNSKANLRLGATVQNVFVITNYKGLDPEIGGGIDNNFYPRPRTYVLGLNLNF